MFEVFSTREVATGIYLVLFILVLIFKARATNAVIALVKTLLNKVFIIPVLCLFAYAVLIVYGLQFIPLWDWVLIKDVIIWVLFVATPICFRAATRKNGGYPFRQMVVDNFIWTAIIEFFVGSFTFSFWIEMLVITIFTFIALLQSYCKNKTQYKDTQKALNVISVISGFILLIATINVAIKSIVRDGITDVLISFSVPIIFSVLFLPLVYFIAVNGHYHDLFLLMKIRDKDGKKQLKKKKKAVFKACGFSYKKV